MTTPIGHNRCEQCATLSPLYQPWPVCRDCSETTCPQCTTPGSLHETDGTRPDSVQCFTCGACTHCEAATATKHTEPASPHDPLCQTCDSALWAVCDGCGARVHHEDLGEILIAHASQGGPAEYAPCCIECRPEADPEPDYDRQRDEQEGL